MHDNNGKKYPDLEAVSRRLNGAVYTPTKLADYLAGKLVQFYSEDLAARKDNIDPTRLRVLDPACGDGELLVSLWQCLSRALKRRFHVEVNPHAVLSGIDIEPSAVRQTRKRLRALGLFSTQRRPLNVYLANALYPVENNSSHQGWTNLLARLGAGEGLDIVIANPPWGADVTSYKQELEKGEFVLFERQFDTSDLFVELALRTLRKGGYLGFIIPDSLFSQERSSLRRLLLEQTDIRLVARMGEKIFEKINRACTVIVCRKKVQQEQQPTATQCVRLTPSVRNRILSGEIDFTDAEHELSHFVPQNRFFTNKDFLFDIDMSVEEERTLSRLRNIGSRLAEFLQSSRGIELSKSGKIYQCPTCKFWMPLPTRSSSRCLHCSANFELDATRVISIVSRHPYAKRQPLLVGESVKRYALEKPLWIELHKMGINYKAAHVYDGPKLLVRKTGVGISAAIDYTNALTNQVVYMFKLRTEIVSQLALEFFLGVMNSRAMYYYLVKNHGETEWRSHPYVTQKQILDLPVPSHQALMNGNRPITLEVSRIIRHYTSRNLPVPPEVDAKIERFVANLYRLSREDYETIYKTLDSVQDLLPVRALKNISIGDIFSA